MRHEVTSLLALGPLPSIEYATVEKLEAIEQALARVRSPLTDEEARELVGLFGPDDCFGLALLHLIETAPGWPIEEALGDTNIEWALRLRERAS